MSKSIRKRLNELGYGNIELKGETKLFPDNQTDFEELLDVFGYSIECGDYGEDLVGNDFGLFEGKKGGYNLFYKYEYSNNGWGEWRVVYVARGNKEVKRFYAMQASIDKYLAENGYEEE